MRVHERVGAEEDELVRAEWRTRRLRRELKGGREGGSAHLRAHSSSLIWSLSFPSCPSFLVPSFWSLCSLVKFSLLVPRATSRRP
eukprot:1580901-Rhodomonas_salina.1